MRVLWNHKVVHSTTVPSDREVLTLEYDEAPVVPAESVSFTIPAHEPFTGEFEATVGYPSAPFSTPYADAATSIPGDQVNLFALGYYTITWTVDYTCTSPDAVLRMATGGTGAYAGDAQVGLDETSASKTVEFTADFPLDTFLGLIDESDPRVVVFFEVEMRQFGTVTIGESHVTLGYTPFDWKPRSFNVPVRASNVLELRSEGKPCMVRRIALTDNIGLTHYGRPPTGPAWVALDADGPYVLGSPPVSLTLPYQVGLAVPSYTGRGLEARMFTTGIVGTYFPYLVLDPHISVTGIGGAEFSDDQGATWSLARSNTWIYWMLYDHDRDILWGYEIYDDVVLASYDGGRTWTPLTVHLRAGGIGTEQLVSGIYGDGWYVVIGDADASDVTLFGQARDLLYSKNAGANFHATHPDSSMRLVYTLRWSGSYWYAVVLHSTYSGGVYHNSTLIYRSTDLVTWTLIPTPAPPGPYDDAIDAAQDTFGMSRAWAHGSVFGYIAGVSTSGSFAGTMLVRTVGGGDAEFIAPAGLGSGRYLTGVWYKPLDGVLVGISAPAYPSADDWLLHYSLDDGETWDGGVATAGSGSGTGGRVAATGPDNAFYAIVGKPASGDSDYIPDTVVSGTYVSIDSLAAGYTKTGGLPPLTFPFFFDMQVVPASARVLFDVETLAAGKPNPRLLFE